MEAFIREARMVTLSFFVSDIALKKYANVLIERRIGETSGQFSVNISINEMRTRTLDNYYEMGSRYFRRYAFTNLMMFMDENSRNRFSYLVEEITLIDEVITELRQGIRF